MRIGIDIDGVLTDYEKFQLENLSKYYWNIHWYIKVFYR